MMRQSRRHFIKNSAASLMVLAGASAIPFMPDDFVGVAQAAETAAPASAPKGREFIMLCDTFEKAVSHGEQRYTKASRSGFIKALDVASNEMTTLDIPFFGHMVDQDPLNPKHLITFEKWGQNGAVVDLDSKKTVTTIQPIKDHEFFGHAVFNADGRYIADTEHDFEQSNGKLVIRSTSDMKVVDTHLSYGLRPHDCFSADGGKTIIVANTGHILGTPSVSWVDFESGKLVNQVMMDKAQEVFYMHANLSYDGWLSVYGRAQPGSKKEHFELITFVSPDGRVCPLTLPKDLKKKMKGEALSTAYIGQTGLVAVTLPDANLLLVADYKTQKLIDAFALPRPKGVLPVLNPKNGEPNLLASLSGVRKLVSMNINTQKKKPAPPYRQRRHGRPRFAYHQNICLMVPREGICSVVEHVEYTR